VRAGCSSTHARLMTDLQLRLEDSLAALSLLVALRGRRGQEAAQAPASFLPLNQTYLPASRVLFRWAGERRDGRSG
jgi:hypothetical protein